MRMMKLSLLSLAIAGTTFSHAAFAEESFSNLFSEAKPILDARYRYEHVDQDNALKHANAQTLRTRVGVQSGKWYGLSALIEADNVSRIGNASYNETRNGQSEYSVVA
ncbi:alginate export family protein, partial [Pseudomonas peli]